MNVWQMIKSDNISAVVNSKSCKRTQNNGVDASHVAFNVENVKAGGMQLLITKFCTFAEPQQLNLYNTILTPKPYKHISYTLIREDVCIDEIGRPPKA
ncbi:MAG: hypothetical protein PHV53_09040 [Fermentimonas sp.]|nr:hypothetical protein [Fermentimonas sp.]